MTPAQLAAYARRLSASIDLALCTGGIVLYLPWAMPDTGETGETAIPCYSAAEVRNALGY